MNVSRNSAENSDQTELGSLPSPLLSNDEYANLTDSGNPLCHVEREAYASEVSVHDEEYKPKTFMDTRGDNTES